MQIKEINDKNIWENFLVTCQEKTFLQSWNWGEFQKMMGNKIWRLGVYDEETLIGAALISEIKAKRGKFLLIQHGPNVKDRAPEVLIAFQKSKILEILLEELKKINKEERVDFIRMNPLWEKNQENQDILRNLGFRESPMHANAYEATWRLDIASSEEELLAGMRRTTRYLIRQAMKNQDIIVEKSEDLKHFETYRNLNEEVAERQKFVPFSAEYMKKEFEVFSKDKEALWLFGKYKEDVAAGALIIFWQGIGFYHQAASLGKFVKLSVPYLVQWEAIKEAKKRGCQLYDFWGYVDPKLEPRHPWAGPTLFKMGFGGKAHEYVKTQDFPLSKKYWFTFIFERIRKIKRGL